MDRHCGPLQWKCGILTTGLPGKPWHYFSYWGKEETCTAPGPSRDPFPCPDPTFFPPVLGVRGHAGPTSGPFYSVSSHVCFLGWRLHPGTRRPVVWQMRGSAFLIAQASRLGIRPACGLHLTLTRSWAAWSPLMDVLALPDLAPLVCNHCLQVRTQINLRS